MTRRIPTIGGVCLALMLVVALPAAASTWGGENGVVTLSFGTGEELESVRTTDPADADRPLFVDVYAVLTDFDPVAFRDEQVLSTAGFEVKLQIDGEGGTIISKQMDYQKLDFGQSPAQCQVGTARPLKPKDGRITLVCWRVFFDKAPGPVAFRLDPTGALTCNKFTACADVGGYAVYTGSGVGAQDGLFFTAGYRPAYLNWEGEPDLAPLTMGSNWRELGLCTPANADAPVPKTD